MEWNANEILLVWIVGIIYVAHLFKKAASKNPEVTDAAKKAATAKAIGMIGKWLK
jgi:hypothetical protein